MREDPLTYRFDDFVLDVPNRRLYRAGTPVELSARYFDALALLVREAGRLVSKERFFDEVWHDVVVSDGALTQCIKDIRRQLGDDAARPRFVETVPRHGYRFVAPVVPAPDPGTPLPGATAPYSRSAAGALPAGIGREDLSREEPLWEEPLRREPLRAASRGAAWRAVRRGAAGALGGGVAGVFGGLLYGAALAQGPAGVALGTASVLVVLLSLNVLVGFVGGAGVGFGMAVSGWLAGRLTGRPAAWSVAGAAAGGLLVGSGAKLLGVDAFNLLFGAAPRGITGGLEGAALGAALALGGRLGARLAALRDGGGPWWAPAAGAGVLCAAAGALIPLAGGRLMGGSLALVARQFADSRLELSALGAFFGEADFGRAAEAALGGVEGLLFGACVAGALVLVERLHPAILGARAPEQRARESAGSASGAAGA